jgi:hypothetical protein
MGCSNQKADACAPARRMTTKGELRLLRRNERDADRFAPLRE